MNSRRGRPRGWLSPLYSMMDSMGQGWWNLKRFFSKLFDFRWLTSSLVSWLQYFWNAAKYPFIVLNSLLHQCWNVLVAWWQIRNFRYLIQGLPALIAIIFIIIIACYTWLRSDDGIQELYLRQANDARLRSDKQRAQLCYERLMQLQYTGDPRRLETQFNLGQLALELQQYQRSRSLLEELSNPDNDEGYADAHIQRARMIFQTSRRTKEDLDLMEKHLRRALKKQSENKTANGLLGIILWMRGRNDEAILCLQKSDPQDVAARITLAKIHKAMGNLQQAALYVDPLIDYLKNHANGEIDDVRFRSTLADAYMQMDQYEDAIKVLENAYAMKKSDFFKMALSNSYTEWFKKLTPLQQTPERERQKLDCLVRALEWDNTNVQALKFLVLYMNTSGNDSAERDRAHRMLTALRGNNAYLHLWLGEKLMDQGKFDEAKQEWDMAYKLNPDSPTIANNFAWILTQGSSTPPLSLAPDLLKAERIMNQVISRASADDVNKPYYHGTRGTIYMKMGRYQEALTDLVAASQRDDANPMSAKAMQSISLHQQLVEVYDRLRMTTMSDNHRKIIAEIIKRNTRTDAGTQ